MSINSGPVKLGVLNIRSIKNKGPFLAGILISHDLTSFVHLSDNNSFLGYVTPDFVFLQRPHSSGIGCGVSFFIRCPHKQHKMVSCILVL